MASRSSPRRCTDFAAEYKISIGTSFEEVIADPQIEAVILATPHSKHRAQVEAAAAAKKHIYCEKPFALTKAEAAAMLDASPAPASSSALAIISA